MNIFFWKKRPKCVLVVEDEPDISSSLEARLSYEGFAVETAENGQEGVEKARSKKPDVIIMDVMMPLVDGYQACNILKKDDRTRAIPILVLTALPHLRDAETAFGTGADAFLNKPYSNDRLIDKINQLIKIAADKKKNDGA